MLILINFIKYRKGIPNFPVSAQYFDESIATPSDYLRYLTENAVSKIDKEAFEYEN
jgi:hypothetical protein